MGNISSIFLKDMEEKTEIYLTVIELQVGIKPDTFTSNHFSLIVLSLKIILLQVDTEI